MPLSQLELNNLFLGVALLCTPWVWLNSCLGAEGMSWPHLEMDTSLSSQLSSGKVPYFVLGLSNLMIFSVIFTFSMAFSVSLRAVITVTWHPSDDQNLDHWLRRRSTKKRKCFLFKVISFWPPISASGWKQWGKKFLVSLNTWFQLGACNLVAVLKCLIKRRFLNYNCLSTPLEIFWIWYDFDIIEPKMALDTLINFPLKEKKNRTDRKRGTESQKPLVDQNHLLLKMGSKKEKVSSFTGYISPWRAEHCSVSLLVCASMDAGEQAGKARDP